MALATLGVVVPGIAAIYEFGVKGRKRLGYRVQMDTTATNVVETDDPGVFDQLREPLVDPTLVLLRIENSGQTHIDEDDYAVLHDKKAGITVTFPGYPPPRPPGCPGRLHQTNLTGAMCYAAVARPS